MPIQSKPSLFFGRTFMTRKIIAGFIDLLIDRIFVERYNDLGAVSKYIKPPIQYSNVDRLFHVLRASNNADWTDHATVNNILPRMAVNVSGLSYRSETKLNNYQKRISNTISDNNINNIIVPVPYIMEIELSLITKSIDDTYQIIEQIMPLFTPSYTLELNLLPGYDTDEVTFTLTSVIPDSDEDYGVIDARIFNSTISFSANVNYYYIKKNSKIARDILINFNAETDEDYKKFQSYQLSENSISPVIEMDVDDFDITTEITDY